jgi:fructose-specific phosphotransferase system IIC component
MNEILHANIFFIIATIATVVFCILTCVILYHVIKIVQSIRSIIERIQSGSEVIARDVAQVRELVASGGLMAKAIKFAMGLRGTQTRKDKNKD